jgi:cytosine/adenosine deaminase-related metal-dependent hydrolase
MHGSYALLLTFAAAAACAAPFTREDRVVLQGNVAGRQTVRDDHASGTRTRFSFNDRGRGDDVDAHWQLDADGIPTEYRAKGKDYMKAAVEETFRISGGKARWKSTREQGERALTAPAFYMPSSAPPEFLGVLARALLRAPDQRLALLPGGEASIEKGETLRIDGLHGPSDITLYRITGLEFTPTSIWLDAYGHTAASIFASGWVAILPEEFRPAQAQIVAAQERADAAWAARLARELTHVPKGALLIRHARLFDPRDLAATPNVSVLVRGERIVRVAPDDQVEAPADAEIVDARGRFLMPGLWDVHKHFAEADGALDIANGVTSGRDLANNTDVFLERVRRFDAGTEIGPRVSLAGLIDGPGPFAGPTKMLVATPEEALEAVDWYADHGYVQIKTYSSLKPELFPLIAARAHERGLRISGHVPAFMSARQFVKAGADEIQHINFVFLNFMFPRIQDTRNMTRLTEIGAHGRDYTPEQPQVREFIAFLKRHHTVIDPTLTVFEDTFSGSAEQRVPPGLLPVVDRLPPQARRNLSFGKLPIPKGQESAYAEAFPALMRMVKALHDGGVTLMPGTDAHAGYLLHAELEAYARAGIPNAEVLRMATLTPAEVMGVAKDRGVIAPGKLADMVLVDGDPLADMRQIRNIDVVFKGGKLFDPAAIERALGIRPRKEAAAP